MPTFPRRSVRTARQTDLFAGLWPDGIAGASLPPRPIIGSGSTCPDVADLVAFLNAHGASIPSYEDHVTGEVLAAVRSVRELIGCPLDPLVEAEHLIGPNLWAAVNAWQAQG